MAFRAILRHEWKTLAADRTAGLVFILLPVMMALAVFNVSESRRRLEESERANIETEGLRFQAYQRQAADIEREAASRGEEPPAFEPDMIKAPSMKYGPRDSLYVWAWNALKIVPPPSPMMESICKDETSLAPFSSSSVLGLTSKS